MTHDNANETELPWTTRLRMSLAVPILRLLGRALLANCRIEPVDRKADLATLLDNNQTMLLCCWHQRLSVSVRYLLRRRGLRPGFLVSPSRDGELVARVQALDKALDTLTAKAEVMVGTAPRQPEG